MSDPYGPPGAYPNQPPPWQQPGTGQGSTQPVSGGGGAPGYPPPQGAGWPQSGEPQSGPPQSGPPQSGPPQYGAPQYGAPQPQQPYGAPQGQPQSQPQYGTPQDQPQYGAPQTQQPYAPGQQYAPGQYTPGQQYAPGQYTPGQQYAPGQYVPGQPQYGAPQGQQPYGSVPGQQPYGAFPGQPYGAPPQPGRSRGPVIAVIVVVAVLLIGGGITAAALLAGGSDSNKNKAGNSSTTGPGGIGSTGGAGSTNGGSGANVTFNAPDQIGSLKKMSDQSEVAPMLDSLKGAGIDNAFAVGYQDPSAIGHNVIAWGGSGKAFEMGGAQTELNAFFKSAVASIAGGSQGPVDKVDAGSLGGTAECTDVSGLDQPTSLCAWTNSEALIGFVFDGFTPDQTRSQVRTMLSAIVKKG